MPFVGTTSFWLFPPTMSFVVQLPWSGPPGNGTPTQSAIPPSRLHRWYTLPSAVANYPINQTGKIGADVGFGTRADAEPSADEPLDGAAAGEETS